MREAVPGRDPVGVEVVGFIVVISGLAYGRTAELVKGLDTHRVVLEHLVAPALGQQGEPEEVVGEGEIRIDPQGFPVMVDRIVDPTTAGIDFAEIEMRGGQLGIGPQGILVFLKRDHPDARAFQAQAEVVAGRAKLGSMRKALRKVVIAPGPQRPSALSSSQPTSTRTRPRLLWTATAFGRRSSAFW